MRPARATLDTDSLVRLALLLVVALLGLKLLEEVVGGLLVGPLGVLEPLVTLVVLVVVVLFAARRL